MKILNVSVTPELSLGPFCSQALPVIPRLV